MDTFLVHQRQKSYCYFILQKEREAYEVIVEDGKFFFKDGKLLDTSNEDKDTKWIFVLSTSKTIYVGKVNFFSCKLHVLFALYCAEIDFISSSPFRSRKACFSIRVFWLEVLHLQLGD